MGTYGYTPPTSKTPGQSPKVSSSDRPKGRIYQEFAHSITLDELSYPATPDGGDKNKIESLASLEYPLIKINDYILANSEIDMMKIDCEDFLPDITLTCSFTHQTFVTREMPKDGDIISVAIRNKSDVLKSIRNDYVITSVVSNEQPGVGPGQVTMTFFGILFIPGLMSSSGQFSYNGTSLETLRAYARWLRLGFATNEDNTNDKQVWIYTKHGNNDTDFPQNITSSAFRDDTSFYSVWIDIYYNLNFVNINKQLMAAENEVDIAAKINVIDKDFTYGESTTQNKTVETPKVLSNFKEFRTTSFYINTWKPINKSSVVTFQIGTKTWCQLFEHNNKIYADDEAKKFWMVEMEPTYDPDKVNKYILLRGRATQDASTKGKDLAKANYSYVDMYARYPWMGVQYTISDSTGSNLNWDGNHHKNYQRAKVQNLINNKELEKLNLEIGVNGINLNIIRADKIPVMLIKTDPVENLIVNKQIESGTALDQFYSGWFIVDSFSILYNKSNAGSIVSNFSQSFKLTRREWPPPIPVDGIPKTQTT